jgi:hypothetical protein
MRTSLAIALLAFSLGGCTKTEPPAAHDSGPADAAPAAEGDADKLDCDKDGRCKVVQISEKTRAALEARPDRQHVTLVFAESTTDEKFATIVKVPWVTAVNLSAAHGITDLEPLASLTMLKELDARHSGVADLAPLARLTALAQLNLNATKVTDVSALKGLTSLTRLFLEEARVTDLSPLAGLAGLKQLDLYGVPAKDWSPLAGLTNLEELQLDHTDLRDASPFSRMKHLRTLRLSSCAKLTDLSALKPLEQLVSLTLENAPVSDITALSKMALLETLELAGTKVTSLEPLKGLRNLRYVTVPYAVTDYAPLFASAKTLDRLVVPRNTPPERTSALLQTNPRIQLTVAP